DVAQSGTEEIDVGAQFVEAVVVNRRADVAVARGCPCAHPVMLRRDARQEASRYASASTSAQMRWMPVALVPLMSTATAQTVALPVAGLKRRGSLVVMRWWTSSNA